MRGQRQGHDPSWALARRVQSGSQAYEAEERVEAVQRGTRYEGPRETHSEPRLGRTQPDTGLAPPGRGLREDTAPPGPRPPPSLGRPERMAATQTRPPSGFRSQVL